MATHSIMSRGALACLIAGLTATRLFAAEPQRHDWQRIQMPTAAAVLAHWTAPPPEYGPEPYYGLSPHVSDADIGSELDRLQRLGFQAVTVQYSRNMPFAYLSAEYFAYFKRFVAQAKGRNMRLWIVDDAGYPSGFAGGKFTSDAPELRMKALIAGGYWMVSSGKTLDEPAPDNVVAVGAIDTVSGKVQPIAVNDGRIHWQAPPTGTWHVVAVVHAFQTSPTRSETNPTGKKDTTQSLSDYLDPRATAAYLRFTHEAYKAAVGDEFGKTILGFRGDEPDYSIQGLPWTDAFLSRFQALKGYDPRPFLPALLTLPVEKLSEMQRLARADYYDVFSQMFAENFFKQQADWCAANGLEYQVHLNHEERQIELAESEGDFFRAMRSVQSPGIDTIWHQLWTDTVSDFPRFGSSVAHLNGRPQAMTESFAAYRPTPTLPIVQYAINEQLVRGINLFEFMYIPGGRPTPSFFADPSFPKVAAYTRRASYLMSMGRPDAKVALLQSRGALWVGDKEADDMFVSTERLLSEVQIDFDLVDEDAIGKLLTAESGAFKTASGNAYRTIIVPMPDLMPARVIARLRAFASSGGKVLFLGRTPPRIVETNYLRARPARADEFNWATVNMSLLSVVPTPDQGPPETPPPPLNAPATVKAALRQAVGIDDLSLATPTTAIRYTHRRLADAEVYFVFNESPKAIATNVTLRGTANQVEIWNPNSGKTLPTASIATPNGRTLPLHLGPYEATILVTRL